jgi:hypothetical protein
MYTVPLQRKLHGSVMGSPTYDLYIDDSGSRLPDRKNSLERNDGMDAFAFGGYLVKAEDATHLNDLHTEFTNSLRISTPLHSTKIRARKDGFRWLSHDEKKASEFYLGLENLISNAPVLATACIVHRPGYNNRYEGRYGPERWHLCKSAYLILIERAAKFAEMHGRRLKVFVEATGKREDRAIKSYHTDLRDHGLPFQPKTSGKYAPLLADDFSRILMKKPQFVTKQNCRIQLADILLYPLIKGQYDAKYPPYMHLLENRKILDQHLDEEEKKLMGIKRYCFL